MSVSTTSGATIGDSLSYESRSGSALEPITDFPQVYGGSTALDTAPASMPLDGMEGGSKTGKNRSKQKHRQIPTVFEQPSEYKAFRRICDQILAQVRELETLNSQEGGISKDEWDGPIIEIKSLLFAMRRVRWGHGDSLKRWTASIIFQIANAALDIRHIKLLGDSTRSLRARYMVDDSAVAECVELIKLHNLDPFRAVTSTPEVKVKYRVVAE